MSVNKSVYQRQLEAVLVLLLLVNTPSRCLSEITFNNPGTDEFEIFLSGIKLFHHNETSPMMSMGKGQTEFVESKGNFRINDYVTSRIPLPYTIIYSDTVPLDIELYMEFDLFVRFQIYEDEKHAMVMEITQFQGALDRLWIRLLAQPEEKVFGGGEQFSYFNLRGQSFPIWTREQGVGRNKSMLSTFYADRSDGAGGDYHTTYFPQPTYISTRGYYLHHEGPDYAVLDFSHEAFHELYVLAERSVSLGRVRLQNGSDVPELLDHLTNFLGRQPPLPEWIYSGAILGIQGGTKKLRGYLAQADDYQLPVAAVWIQDWVGSITTSFGKRLFWDWRWNQQHYPDLPSVITDLSRRGIRVLGYINPYLHKDGQLFAVAEESDYFVKNASNQTFLSDFGEFHCGTVDLTNPAAFDWYKNEVIKNNLIDFGFGGWMADFGEYLPTEGVFFHSGQSAEELHNLWPVLWARLNREAVEESGKLGEIVFWMRAGFSGTGNYSTLMWAGDQNVDWSLSDGLASTITAALSMGMSGAALTHFDIGGFTTFASFTPPLARTEELLLRSAEMAVFTPVFRTHEGNQPSQNVQYYSSRGTLLKFARLSRMFATMKSYTSHVVNTSSATGRPAQSPLFLSYPGDEPSYDVKYQYMYGEDVLVAPVYLPDVESWEVYLPSDLDASWIFLWDESIFSLGGETIQVPAPLGQPPVFYRNVSGFTDVFRRVAAEPLVDVPAYVPESYPVQPGLPECNGVVPLKFCFSRMLMLAILIKTLTL